MAKPFIRLKDKHTHGGKVITAAPASFCLGLPIARKGDKITCPIHGNGEIATGDASVLVDGMPVARRGDKTSCGALLIPSQALTVDLI
ncbi:PAAR domain-containing protein [Massilia atriviolacea]|uniref:PAAR domain-containing protein n=1 Tax=Massilia atriviolacea TaxID=2495579 RepID=A0A430HQ37_9BURK|nr:PAAR domain-containing protein [Massilia atriviolacea]RSZ59630.1 PAAR domain-containing protein [Massilia atriviolacea]